MYGSGGHVAWSVWSWEAFVDGELHSGTHDYGEEDVRGQAAMTNALFDLL